MLHDSLKHNEEVKPNSFEMEKLRRAFPNYFDKDGQFMIDHFMETLNAGDVELSKEGYELKFLGKSYAKYQAGLETETAVIPDMAHNNLPENEDSKNLYIVGDNLDALQHLVKSYAGQVKCIYIDPPYNTGSDGFVYHDDFGFTAEKLVEKIGLEEDEAQRVLDMQGKSYHSAWLTFMYPRLQLARELLADDGVIFISIDDNEQANLKLLCDEIFGSTNFIAQLVWERAFSPKNDARFVSNSHDYVLMVARNIEEFSIGRLPRTQEANARYSNPDNDPRGPWMSSDITVKTYNPSDDYPITTPSGRVVEPPAGRCWRLSKTAFLERLQDNRIWFGQDGDGVPRIKRFLSELKNEGMAPISILHYKEVGHSQSATKELVKLFDGKGLFEGPKPIGLIRRLLTMANLDADSLILDFFSGSATTAQAVMELNAEDGGNRRYIMVQLPEDIDEKKPAYQAGYRTVDEIGRERINRAAAKIIKETGAEIDY
ncbi:MAG: site-specific DNA-methyltransferase, partial [Peptoniphilaceae bacterium]|nr:site-specific DNA-methyltransferase [Peptoniphilaceae bacterium]